MSEQGKWTPGPWEATAEIGGLMGGMVRSAKTRIADVWSGDNTNAQHAQRLANARLIAAAPEMYEALRPLANMGDLSLYAAICRVLSPTERISFGRAVQAARAALAKADGKVTP